MNFVNFPGCKSPFLRDTMLLDRIVCHTNEQLNLSSQAGSGIGQPCFLGKENCCSYLEVRSDLVT